jgi:RimJ/RimL family protein N-acetyltransferase
MIALTFKTTMKNAVHGCSTCTSRPRPREVAWNGDRAIQRLVQQRHGDPDVDPEVRTMSSAPPAASLHQRVLSTWQRAFPELTDPLDQPGTSILSDPQTPATSWVSLWPVGERVVARVAPDIAEQLRAILDELPPGHRLTADDVATCWPDQPIERAPQRLHALDPVAFRSASPAPDQQVRELTEVDRDAFEEFLGQCSPDDRDDGDVDIGGEHELTIGVLLGGRIVAVASMFEWRGFSDLGVLTAPQLRRQGAGKAAVSALCDRLLVGPRVVVYRYSLDNLGSAGVARSLALAPLGIAESARPDDGA